MVSKSGCNSAESLHPITILGSPGVQGGYLLRIQVESPCRIIFGRHNHCRRIYIGSGVYMYLGSAMGIRGSTSLPCRVMRHVIRSGQRPSHKIRDVLRTYLVENKLADNRIEAIRNKRLHWHVDYLLDHENSDLTHIMLLCNQYRIERYVYTVLSNKKEVEIIEPGLGASDTQNKTHLWKLHETDGFWRLLVRELEDLLERS